MGRQRGRRPGESNHRGGALTVRVPDYGKVSFQLLM